MIALVCEVRGTTRHGWVQVSAVIPPSEVSQWCRRFRADDAIRAMWRLAEEVIEATGGRKHWVAHHGNAMEVTWEVHETLRERDILIPTPEGVETVRIVIPEQTA
jgi:hypothetical protein